MLTIQNLFDKYRPMSIDRVNDFLTRKSIEHKCTKLKEIEFKFEDCSWDLYIDDDYFVMCLVFTTIDENSTDKHVNRQIAEQASREATKKLKVLKVHYSSHEYVDEDNGRKLVKYNILQFYFESYCYNMCDFSKLFYDGLNIILAGYNEYHKQYEEIESKLSGSPIGYRNFDSEDTNKESQPTNRRCNGFV